MVRFLKMRAGFSVIQPLHKAAVSPVGLSRVARRRSSARSRAAAMLSVAVFGLVLAGCGATPPPQPQNNAPAIPPQVGVLTSSRNTSGPQCTATVMNNMNSSSGRVIMTAAHCVQSGTGTTYSNFAFAPGFAGVKARYTEDYGHTNSARCPGDWGCPNADAGRTVSSPPYGLFSVSSPPVIDITDDVAFLVTDPDSSGETVGQRVGGGWLLSAGGPTNNVKYAIYGYDVNWTYWDNSDCPAYGGSVYHISGICFNQYGSGSTSVLHWCPNYVSSNGNGGLASNGVCGLGTFASGGPWADPSTNPPQIVGINQGPLNTPSPDNLTRENSAGVLSSSNIHVKNALDTADSQASLGGGVYDDSFEHTDKWPTLNGGTQQNDVCDGTAKDGNCFLDVSGSAAPYNTFFEDFSYPTSQGQCFVLSAWFRARSSGSFSGTLTLWAIDPGIKSTGNNFPISLSGPSLTWTHVSVVEKIPAPPPGGAWTHLRGQLYIGTPNFLLDWDLAQWFGPYSC